MSGHSKWSTIKRQKGVADAKRGNLFTKLGNAITIAVREGGGGDPNFNFKLRLAVEKAREANMPKDNIQRAIDKGLGKGEGGALETAVFEGFGPAGVAVIVETITDNTNRTAGELRNFFDKHGGSLGGPGSVAYLFKKVGCLRLLGNLGSLSPDEVLEKAAEAGAEDVENGEGEFLVYTKVEDLHRVKERLTEQGLTVASAEVVYRPNRETMVDLEDSGKRLEISRFLEGLEELDDVQNVFVNV
ncbi:MAG: transcriptional regulator [Microgenomates group bacterium GW2011_GWA1_48_10]|nr:MAG: transcriptional regulator [Microgenomates group bacterium GW2011_GWA1_48_10]